MPTGAGKTRTVIQSLIEYQLAEKFFDKEKIIIWLAHTEELCEQAIDTLKSLWLNLSSNPTKIIRCWGNFNPIITDITGGFVFGTLQKFYGLLRTNSFLLEMLKRKLKVLVIDEAHKSTALSYSKIINHITENENVSLIGITATPGRAVANSKENLELARFYSKKLLSPQFQKNPITELREKGVLSKLKRQVIETKIDISIKENELDELNPDQDIPITTIKKLSNNVKRNKTIISCINSEVQKKNPCLIFSCSIEHSNLLSAALNFNGVKAASIDSKTNKSHRKIVIQEYKEGKFDVLLNYGVLSTGFDAPRIRTIIVTRPTSSVVLYSQIIGRGLRGPKMGGAETCNLIDIKDNFINFGGVEDVYSFFEDYWN